LAEKIPAWFGSAVARYLAPEITRIVDERVTRSEDALKELMKARFATLDAKIDGLEKRLDLVQLAALLEAKVREIEAKRAVCLRDQIRYQVPSVPRLGTALSNSDYLTSPFSQTNSISRIMPTSRTEDMRTP